MTAIPSLKGLTPGLYWDQSINSGILAVREQGCGEAQSALGRWG